MRNDRGPAGSIGRRPIDHMERASLDCDLVECASRVIRWRRPEWRAPPCRESPSGRVRRSPSAGKFRRPQALAVGQLSEGHRRILIPTSEAPGSSQSTIPDSSDTQWPAPETVKCEMRPVSRGVQSPGPLAGAAPEARDRAGGLPSPQVLARRQNGHTQHLTSKEAAEALLVARDQV